MPPIFSKLDRPKCVTTLPALSKEAITVLPRRMFTPPPKAIAIGSANSWKKSAVPEIRLNNESSRMSLYASSSNGSMLYMAAATD